MILQVKGYNLLHFLARVLLFVSSCCNPVLYGLLNNNYRT